MNLFLEVQDWLSRRPRSGGVDVLCLEAIGLLEEPSVGTARNPLLAVEVAQLLPCWFGEADKPLGRISDY